MKRNLKLLALCLGMTALLCGCSSNKAAETQSENAAETVTETEDTTIYAFEYDVASMVKLGEYKGQTYTIVDTTVTDEEVEEDIQSTLTAYAYPEEITDRTVEDGDVVNIDYEGLLDGEAFTGGTATGASLEIGSNSFIDGFEEGLIGVTPGEEISLDLTFPEDYSLNADLAGKAVVFNVTVNYIEGDTIVPELDDTFVQELGITDVTTTDEFRTYVREQLVAVKESEAESSRQSELFQKAVENAEVTEYPEELVAQYTDEFTSYYEQYASYFGIELAEFITEYMGMTEEDFYTEAERYGTEVTGNMLIVCAIAEAEGIEVTDEFYAEKAAELADESGYEDVETLEADYGRDYLTQIIIYQEVMNILEKDAVGVEAAETEAETVTE